MGLRLGSHWAWSPGTLAWQVPTLPAGRSRRRRSSRCIPLAARSPTLVCAVFLSCWQIIDREEKYGAHNYHPLPVVLNRGQGIHM